MRKVRYKVKVIFAPFPKSKIAKISFWLILLVLLMLVLIYIMPKNTPITKEDVLQAIYNTQQSENYRFQITTQITFKGVDNNLSDVMGEKNKSSLHIVGKFLKTPLEIYQLANITYRLDPLAKNWIVIKNNTSAEEEVLATELNPAAPLNFTAINTFSSRGIENYNEKKSYRVELVPDVSTPFLANYWTNFKYIIWMDKSRKYLNGYEITATSKKDVTGNVKMHVKFKGYGEINTIRSPL